MQFLVDHIPLIYIFLSGVGYSIQALIVKILAEENVHGSFYCVLTRGVCQLCITSWVIYQAHITLPPLPTSISSSNKSTEIIEPVPLFGKTVYIRVILSLRAILGFGSIAFSYLSTEYISIGDSTVLTMLSVVIASIASFLLLGEPWRIPEMVATFLSLVGAVLVTKPSFIFGGSGISPSSHKFTIGVVSALTAAIFTGFAYICIRILGTTAKMPWPNVVFSQAIAQIVFSPICLYYQLSLNNQSIIMQSSELSFNQMALIFIAGFIGAWSQIAMTVGMQREKSATASAMRMSDIIFGFIWQILFTTDSISYLSVIGSILVSGSIIIVVMFKQSECVSQGVVPLTTIELTDMEKSSHGLLETMNSNDDGSSHE